MNLMRDLRKRGRLLSIGLVVTGMGFGPGCMRPDQGRASQIRGHVPELRLTRTIPLPGVGGDGGSSGMPGRFDHFAYDAGTHRLFVAAVANGSLEVIDLDKAVRVKSIGGLGHPQGVAVAATIGLAIVACGSEGAIRAYDTQTLEEKGRLEIGEDPDNVRFVAGHLYVGYGPETAGAIVTIDPKPLRRISEMPLKAHPESFQLTPDGRRVFVNIPWSKRSDIDGSVVAGDLEAGKVESTWTLAQTARNFPMALDVEREHVFVASRKPAKLVCLNSKTGQVISEAPCAPDSDDIYRDPNTGHLIVIGGGDREKPGSDGAIDVFSVGGIGKLDRIATVTTAPMARTGYFSADRRAVYVAVPAKDGRDAEIREYTLVD